MSYLNIDLQVEDPSRQAEADHIQSLFPPNTDSIVGGSDYVLWFTAEKVVLRSKDRKVLGDIWVDFASGKANHRRQFGGGHGQLIAKAVGTSTIKGLKVFDATAGLGADAFVLASLGSQVTMMESSPIVYALLKDGLNRALVAEDEELVTLVKGMSLYFGQSVNHLEDCTRGDYDVIYLDPMFPEKTKRKSAVKKEMQALQSLVVNTADEPHFLEAARKVATYRVVVKRPVWAPPLADAKPTYQLKSKTSRYDVYVNKGMTKTG